MNCVIINSYKRKGIIMLRKLNDKLRGAILIIGGALVIYKIIDGAREEQKAAGDGFQSQEFDDIW